MIFVDVHFSLVEMFAFICKVLSNSALELYFFFTSSLNKLSIYLVSTYTLRPLSFFSFDKRLWLIGEISATYRLSSYLIADIWLKSVGYVQSAWFPRAMSDWRPCDGVLVDVVFKTMYNETNISFGFCDTSFNQSLCAFDHIFIAC